MRAIGLGLLGFLAGAVAGFVTLALAALLWFQVQPFVASGVTVGTSLDWLLVLGIALVVAGGGAGGWWLYQRADRQGANTTLLAGLGLVALIIIGLFVLTYFGLAV